MTTAVLPVLYSFRRCPYAMRARLALAVSGCRCELREVVLRDKPHALLQASPKGTVPVLVLREGGKQSVIDQSLDIMLWALARHDPQQWLVPPQGGLQDMLDLLVQCDSAFKFNLDRYKYPDRHAGSAPSAEDAASFAARHRELAAQWLGSLESRLGRGWLFGARPTLADMGILPFVRQFAHVDDAWFKSMPWPAVQKWLADWEDSGLFAAIMPKFQAWREGAPPVVVPPEK
jgi:glutathione S-transferase